MISTETQQTTWDQTLANPYKPQPIVINKGGTLYSGQKIQRNRPCPCGSGKKWKKCCGW